VLLWPRPRPGTTFTQLCRPRWMSSDRCHRTLTLTSAASWGSAGVRQPGTARVSLWARRSSIIIVSVSAMDRSLSATARSALPRFTLSPAAAWPPSPTVAELTAAGLGVVDRQRCPQEAVGG
jgi:hypothetical protein